MAEETVVEPAAPIAEPEAPVTTATPDAPAEKVRDPNTVYKQEDVDKIVKAAKANERFRTRREVEAYYKGQMEATRVQAPPAPVVEPSKPAEEEKAPERANYDSYEAFNIALAEYHGRQGYRTEKQRDEAKAKEENAAKTATERSNTFREKLTTKFPDIGERASSVAHIVIPNHLVEAMQESEHGPDILNGFIGDPKELERIMALSPSAALREMGRLEARYEAAAKPDAGQPQPSAAPQAPAPSRAPAPLKTVAGTAVKTDDEPSHDKPDEWRMWREKQLQKRKANGSAKPA